MPMTEGEFDLVDPFAEQDALKERMAIESKAREAYIEKECEITRQLMLEKLKEALGPDGSTRMDRTRRYATWYWDEVLPEREKERARQRIELERRKQK